METKHAITQKNYCTKYVVTPTSNDELKTINLSKTDFQKAHENYSKINPAICLKISILLTLLTCKYLNEVLKYFGFSSQVYNFISNPVFSFTLLLN